MTKITKAVMPVAGFGTRFLPATKAQPKEMLTIIDKPVIQYLVEEAVDSGITDIILITSRHKKSIEDHFDNAFELETKLEQKHKHDLLKEVRKITKLANFIYVRQPVQLGDGHAILCAKEIIKNEPFAVLFGDDIVDSEKPALKQLIEAYEKTQNSIIAVERIKREDTNKYGILDIDEQKSNGRIHKIKSLVEKPEPKNAPSTLGIIGKYIATPEIIPALLSATSGEDNEIRLIDGFIKLLKTQNIYGYEIEGNRYDIGNKLGLIEATINMALKREDTKEAVKKYITTLDLK